VTGLLGKARAAALLSLEGARGTCGGDTERNDPACVLSRAETLSNLPGKCRQRMRGKTNTCKAQLASKKVARLSKASTASP
jgi:hypothetical protein